MTIVLDISVTDRRWPRPEALQALAEQAIGSALHETGHALPRDAELSLVFADDEFVRDLNNKWRGVDAPTNVLAFPSGDTPAAAGAGMMIGDIILARETVVAESELDGKPFQAHLTHLIIHGFLHILGYDHIDEAEAQLMEEVERRALARLGIADPYG